MTGSRLNPIVTAAVAVALAGCSAGGGEATPTPGVEPTFVPVVSATGQVIPLRWASLSLPSGGIVSTLPVAEGDTVARDELLLQLSGREQLEAALAAAELDQIVAQQALDQVHAEEDLARALAQNEVALARDEVREAEYIFSVRQEGNRGTEDTIDGARARLAVAKEKFEEAKEAFDRANGSSDRARAYDDFASAKSSYNSALANYNWYTGHPTDIQQAMLDADVAVAQARLAQAEAAWADVQDGPDPDVLALAEARLNQATAAVWAAEAAVRDAEVRAPFGGTVSAVWTRPDEWVAPGQPVIDLADLTSFKVETTDLSEIDAARVKPEAPVTVTFDALPGVVVRGRVERIAPKASEGSGVNYTACVELDEVPDGLMWG
ncbi:MAG: HlyD protein, partial [Anaerolineales bacterium]|nr:HlyD protein [Anaerolineales bacterium]